ncbi:MAG: ShlB/FhaC/HecB family hemolysin secretion/activation protein [Pseudomonadota bacterium]
MSRRPSPGLASLSAGASALALLCVPHAALAQNESQPGETSQGETAAAPPGGAVQLAMAPAQPAGDPGQSSDGDDGLLIGSIAIEGNEELGADSFATVVEANIGEVMEDEDLRRVVSEVAGIARDRGYVFATARLPEQSVEHGILTIELDEGRIDEVRIKGSDNAALRRFLAPLEGSIAHRETVERRILLAGDLPEIRIRKTRFLKKDGRNILEVRVSENRDRIRAAIDNYGSQRIGPTRARLSYDFRGFLDGSDRGTVSVRSNPLDPEEFAFASASYSVGIGNQGTRVGVAASIGTNQPGGGFVNVEGDTEFVEVFANHPITRSRDASLWVNASLAYLSVEQDDVVGLLRQDNQVTFSVGLSSNVKFLSGRLRTGATLIQGLDVLNATREGSRFASRFDGDAVFTAGNFYANWRGRLGGNWGMLLGVEGQIANRPLLAAQEFNIGGPFSVRGFDFAELAGDNGFAAIAEINYTFRKPTDWIDRLQPYGFIDGGYVDDLQLLRGGGTLISSGLGLRGNAGPVNFELEGAVPLNRDRNQSRDRSPHLNVRVGLDL